MADVAAQRPAIESHGVRLALVHMGTDAEAAAVTDRYGLADLPRFSDPDRSLYAAFELERGRLGQLLGLRVLVRALSRLFRGHGTGRPVGDARQMPGLFLLRDGAIVRGFRHETAADRPNYLEFAGVAPQ